MNRPEAVALGKKKHACVTAFIHFPLNQNPLFETHNFDLFLREHCHSLSGHSLWYDVKFLHDGTLLVRGSPCGDTIESIGHFWESVSFLKDVEKVYTLDMSSLGRCAEEKMSLERKAYLFEKIRPFVSLGEKLYPRHIEFGKIIYRVFTCPSGESDDTVTVEEAQKQLIMDTTRPTINRTAIRNLRKPGLIQAILRRENNHTEANLQKMLVSELREILYRHAPPSLKRKQKGNIE